MMELNPVGPEFLHKVVVDSHVLGQLESDLAAAVTVCIPKCEQCLGYNSSVSD